MFQILNNGLVSNSLLDPPLGFDVERICVEPLDLPHTIHLCVPRLSQELCKPGWIRLSGIGQFRLSLKSCHKSSVVEDKVEYRTSCSCLIRLGSPRICKRIISASRSISLFQSMSCGIGVIAATTYRPATLTFLRSRIIALSPTPSCLIVDLGLFSSVPL